MMTECVDKLLFLSQKDGYGCDNYLFGNFIISFSYFYHTWNKAVQGQKTGNNQHGRKPPHEDELTSVAEWNHRHGRNFIAFCCILFITQSVFVYFIEKPDGVVFQVVIYMIAIYYKSLEILSTIQNFLNTVNYKQIGMQITVYKSKRYYKQ